jgi:hypothetical protein
MRDNGGGGDMTLQSDQTGAVGELIVTPPSA